MGLSAVFFHRDLAMRDFVKYKANYKLFRGAYVVVGIVFIVVSVLTWLIMANFSIECDPRHR